MLNHKTSDKHWKFIYYEALKDFKQNLITENELINTVWQFEHTANVFGSMTNETPKFQANGQYKTSQSILPTNFVVLNNGSQIKIGGFPPLSITRTFVGGWVLKNDFCVITSNGPYYNVLK
ncbi:hypothetical protein AKO1_009669 [Acrasis kona]